MELIREKTGCRIAYKESDLENGKEIHLDYENEPLDAILKDALERYGLMFVKRGNQLIIKRKKLSRHKLENLSDSVTKIQCVIFICRK